jgi:hypothetical protein
MPRCPKVLAIAVVVATALAIAYGAKLAGASDRPDGRLSRLSADDTSGGGDRFASSSDSSRSSESSRFETVKPAVLSALALAKALLRAASAIVHTVTHTTKLVFAALT